MPGAFRTAKLAARAGRSSRSNRRSTGLEDRPLRPGRSVSFAPARQVRKDPHDRAIVLIDSAEPTSSQVLLAGEPVGESVRGRFRQDIGRDTPRLPIRGAVRVDRYEQVGAMACGEGRPLSKFQEHVAVAREEHPHRATAFESTRQGSGNVQVDVLLHSPAYADGARILAAVTRVDDDGPPGRFRLSRR